MKVILILLMALPIILCSQSHLEVDGKIKIGDDTSTPIEGEIRYNATNKIFEGFNGQIWHRLSPNPPMGKATFTESQVVTDNGGIVAHFGDFVIVGDPSQKNAKLYKLDNDQWNLVKTIVEAPTSARLFGHSVDISNNNIVIAAPGNSTNLGKVYIYTYDLQGTTSLTRTLTETNLGSEYGDLVKINGNNLAIGAPRYDGFQGGIYTYEYTITVTSFNPLTFSNSWIKRLELTGLGGCGGYFGTSFAFRDNSNYLLVGVPDGADNICGFGRVEVFHKGILGYSKIQTINSTSSGGLFNDLLGYRLDCTTDKALIGKYGSSADIYKFTPQETGPDTLKYESSLELPNSQILMDLQIENGTIVIGGRHTNGFREACVFYQNGNNWTSTSSLKPSSGDFDFWGNSISLDQERVIIGDYNKFYWY